MTMMNSFVVTRDCNGCGVCEKICPTQNIEIKDGRAVHGKTCAACYACMHWCPAFATKLKFRPLRRKKQYTHPEVALRDIVCR